VKAVSRKTLQQTNMRMVCETAGFKPEVNDRGTDGWWDQWIDRKRSHGMREMWIRNRKTWMRLLDWGMELIPKTRRCIRYL